MRKDWQYHRGEWTEIDDPLPMSTDPSLEAQMKSAGFEKWHILGGEEFYPSLEVWWHTKNTETPPLHNYYVWYSLSGNAAEVIWITDFPSLMQFIREHAPVIQAQTQLEFEKQRQSMLEKTFHVWHEHSFDEICRYCDPPEYEYRQRARMERLEKKRQESNKGVNKNG